MGRMVNVARRLAADNRGAITPLMLTLFIGLVLVTGAALDLMRHESDRAALQQALDRGLLAALSPVEGRPVEAVLDDYLVQFVQVRGGTVSQPRLSVRRSGPEAPEPWIEVTAEAATAPMVLRMAGIDGLTLRARAVASPPPDPVELVLAVDVSSSLRVGQRLPALKSALTDFVEESLRGRRQTTTSIALVPFAGRVNPGPWMFDALGGRRMHRISSCLEFDEADFGTTELTREARRGHTPHEGSWPVIGRWMGRGWCPADPEMGYISQATGQLTSWHDAQRYGGVDQMIVNGTAISYPISEPDVLRRRIEGIRLFHGSATHYGLKWSLALLDPANEALIAGAAADAARFATRPAATGVSRPAAWRQAGGRKAVILVTDGAVSEVRRPDVAEGGLGGAARTGMDRPASMLEELTADGGAALLARQCAVAAERGISVYLVALSATVEAMADLEACVVESQGAVRLLRATPDSLADRLFHIRRLIEAPRLKS
ncbi:MAG: pilus assembly protein TadG-related protein [Pseudomonadota bacterium]